jgi:hypothetical protein
MNSTLDYTMADSADREWIQSPWVFPNGTIYALTHMECVPSSICFDGGYGEIWSG